MSEPLDLGAIEKACAEANELSTKVQQEAKGLLGEPDGRMLPHAYQCSVWVPTLVAEVRRLREALEAQRSQLERDVERRAPREPEPAAKLATDIRCKRCRHWDVQHDLEGCGVWFCICDVPYGPPESRNPPPEAPRETEPSKCCGGPFDCESCPGEPER